eukprot:m.32984 g.32984  ORF g.32984 m.32984 type:complete len:83 (+) comp16735_c0_seq1:8-256(+)
MFMLVVIVSVCIFVYTATHACVHQKDSVMAAHASSEGFIQDTLTGCTLSTRDLLSLDTANFVITKLQPKERPTSTPPSVQTS